ncbi:hypothetical protein SAMN04487766_12417 [Actinomyces ruminicola]|uniref:HTH-like domain-containing protein n=1 Tax=Actinomyces ruminicola TaxID=332524 RepID=A0A1H0AER1_9ACTO|nr:hypothetical protein SAMN04487766_12417 [Actinomyces ruminicola]
MTARYELIRHEEGNYPIAWMCEWAQVSKSGYYNWLSRPESATAIRRRELAGHIEKVFDESDGTYGYRRIAAALPSTSPTNEPSTPSATSPASPRTRPAPAPTTTPSSPTTPTTKTNYPPWPFRMRLMRGC